MEKKMFNVGDKVMYEDSGSLDSLSGKMGVIRDIDDGELFVEWDGAVHSTQQGGIGTMVVGVEDGGCWVDESRVVRHA